MNNSHTIKLLIITFTLGIMIDISWVKHEAKEHSKETVSYLVESMDKILSKIDEQLITLSQSYSPCSNESRKQLEQMIFDSSILQEITYVENSQFKCSDRDIGSNQNLSPLHLQYTANTDNSVIYRAASQRRNIEGIFYMLPVNNGWFRVLFDAKYMDFWVNELTEHHFFYGCMLDNHNANLYRCNKEQADRIIHSTSLHSKKYPFAAVTGYTDDMFFHLILNQLPYAMIIIVSLSGIVTLLAHAYCNWRRSLVSDIQRGIDNKEFYAFYQPIVNSKTGEWQGAELLVRWIHPNSGVISPAEFIPAAEQSGLINDITLQLLERAAYEKETINAISQNNYLSINVTASMIANASYVDKLIEIINTYPSLQANVALEFTERETFSNTEIDSLQSGMQKLREVGMRWALDDFGTGYAGLSTLQTLSFDILKIDRTFVASSVTDAVTHSILGNIAEMGHELKCSLVAEGVETAEQAEHVAQLGIQFCQGFYFDKPMSFEDYFTKLESMHHASQTTGAEQHDYLGAHQ